jgi:hypothetical protein
VRARWPLLALALAAPAHAEPPVCRAEVLLEPERAVVGQQVRQRVRIERLGDVVRVDWLVPPSFANARVELLPSEPRPRVTRDGVAYEVHDEVRALFPERPGRMRLPGASLRCAREGGGAQDVDLPDAVLDVDPLPAAGRPPGFTGLVGPLWLHLTVTPERVALGASVRVALMARGGGNVWLLDEPFARDAFPGTEVFPRPPELAFERGRDLIARQHIGLDLVPRRTGRLRIPALAVPYFDPDGGIYRVATTGEVEVLVEEQAKGAPLAPEVRGATPLARASGPGTARVVALGGMVALAAAATWWWRRRRADVGRADLALERAAEARAAGDTPGELAAFARALRAALEPHVPGVAALSVEELRARDLAAPALAAVGLLEAVERARYEPGVAPPSAEQVVRAVRGLAPRSGTRLGDFLAGVFPLWAALLVFAGLAPGCASNDTTRDAPMTPARLESWLREETVGLEEVEGQLRFTHEGVRMIVLQDVRADRVRLVASVTEESALTVASSRILLQANFGQTLDARYAIKDGVLYAVYLHPLSTLDPAELETALDQVANLVQNYGTSYSAAEH